MLTRGRLLAGKKQRKGNSSLLFFLSLSLSLSFFSRNAVCGRYDARLVFPLCELPDEFRTRAGAVTCALHPLDRRQGHPCALRRDAECGRTYGRRLTLGAKVSPRRMPASLARENWDKLLREVLALRESREISADRPINFLIKFAIFFFLFSSPESTF